MRVRDATAFALSLAWSIAGVSCGGASTVPTPPQPMLAILSIGVSDNDTAPFGAAIPVTIRSTVTTDSATLLIQPNGGVIPDFYDAYVCLSTDGSRIAAPCVHPVIAANESTTALAPGVAASSQLSRTGAIVAFLIEGDNPRPYGAGDTIPSNAVAVDRRLVTITWY